MTEPADRLRVLYISRFFPPAYSIGGKRAWRMARYVPALGVDLVVLTDVEPPPDRRDPTPLDLPGSVVVDRGLYPPWWPPRPSGDSDVTVQTPVQSNRKPTLRRRVLRAARPPVTDEWPLVPRQIAYIRALVQQHRIQLIHASGGPPATLLHGWVAARATGLPLVAELRDPWTVSQLAMPASPLHHRAEQALERQILTSARRVVVTAEETAAAYRAFLAPLPADHVTVVRNAYEPERAPPRLWQRVPGRLRLVHFGACYAERRLADVLRAIALLRDQQGVDVQGVAVENIGRPAAEDVALAAELGLQRQFVCRPPVPYDEGLRELAAADLLLLPGYGQATQFLPGKLYDYMLAGRPVLATVRPSELSQIVQQTGIGVFAAPGDVQEHARWLQLALDDPQALYSPDAERLRAFAAQPAAEALVAVWRSALG